MAVDALIAPVSGDLEIFGALSTNPQRDSVETFDLVWVMNQPAERLARDVWQILWRLSRRSRFVNSVEALVATNNKSNLSCVVPADHLLDSRVSNEFETLWQLCKSQGGTWVVKPTNQDCGWNVFLVDPAGSNSRAILQSMTGNSSASAVGHGASGGRNQYCVLQRYAPEIVRGEKRVILAGGQILGQHGRIAAGGEHRSNMAQGGQIYPIELTPDETALCSGLLGSWPSWACYSRGWTCVIPTCWKSIS